MNVSLTPELEKLIQDRVASGGYASASEVVREALRLLDARDRGDADHRAWLREAWREGLASGAARPLDMASVKRAARRRLKDGSASA